MRASAPAFSFSHALRSRPPRDRGGDTLLLRPASVDDIGVSYQVPAPPLHAAPARMPYRVAATNGVPESLPAPAVQRVCVACACAALHFRPS